MPTGQSESRPPSDGRIGFQSLRYRLPLLILTLLTTVGATFGWLAYREVEQALRVTGTERAAHAADQVAGLLGQSVAARVAELRRLAADSLVRDAVRAPRADGSSDQLPALQDYLKRNQQSTISLYDVKGSRVARLSREAENTSAGPSLSEDLSITPAEQVTPLRSREGRLSYAVIVKVAGACVNSVSRTCAETRSA